MCKLSPTEKKIWDLWNKGQSADSIVNLLGLKLSSVRTYLSKIRRKIKSSEPRKIVVEKSVANKSAANKSALRELTKEEIRNSKLKRCSTFDEFLTMMKNVEVLSESAEDRIKEFKHVYCSVCIYPNRCNQCPTKVLMNKYLY